MLCHTVLIALLAATPATDPGERRADRPAHELRAAVHEALRLHATSEGARQDQALVELTALYREVAESRAFSDRSQLQLRTLLRSRLRSSQAQLERELKAGTPAQAAPARPDADSPAGRAILAQVAGNPAVPPANAPPPQAGANRAAPGGLAGGGSAFAAATERNAQQLIDLITDTIEPGSWDVNGGLGTIRFFAPKQVLVIRQTDDVHSQIGGAIQNLRGQQ